jgi:septum formation protein
LQTLILASASPRRREILRNMGVDFTVKSPDVDEGAIPADHPRTLAIRLAYAKAHAILPAAPPDSVVLAADTVVAMDGILFGKPANAEEATAMLRSLSGRTHEVTTGIAIAMSGETEVHLDAQTTRVKFRTLSPQDIAEYVATGESYDKAGGYGIQGHGGALVESIMGDYFNVVGLPCALVADLLQRHTDIPVARIPTAPVGGWQVLENG